VTQEGRRSAALVDRVQAFRLKSRKNRSSLKLRRDVERNLVAKLPILCCLEKPLTRLQLTVPQTDTGRKGENPKAREKTLVKELGKMNP
jgi:hypothetical protein